MRIRVAASTAMTHDVIVSGTVGVYRWWVRKTPGKVVTIHIYGCCWLPRVGGIAVDYPHDGPHRLLLCTDRSCVDGWRGSVVYVMFGAFVEVPSLGGDAAALRVMRQWAQPTTHASACSFVLSNNVAETGAEAAEHICNQLMNRRTALGEHRNA